MIRAGLGRSLYLAQKEILSFFGSSLPPLTLGLIAFLCGLLSALLAGSPGATYEEVTRIIFHFFYVIALMAGLFLTMSSFVAEKKQGTMELLFTLPVSNVEIVLGKFLAYVSLLAVTLLLMTLVYVVGIAEAPWYIALSGCLGLLLVAAYAVAIGMFASSLTDNYLLALLVGSIILIAIDIGGFMGGLLPAPAREMVSYFHGLNQFTPFTRGLLPLKSSTFFAGLCIFFLFLTSRILDSRHWRRS